MGLGGCQGEGRSVLRGGGAGGVRVARGSAQTMLVAVAAV